MTSPPHVEPPAARSRGLIRILIVEPDRHVADVVAAGLIDAGYATVRADSAVDALREEQYANADLVIFDLDRGGMNVFRTMRAQSGACLVAVSASTAEKDLVSALDAGADDYLRKPYGVRELVARVRAVLRRYRCDACGGTRSDVPKAEDDDIEIDRGSFQVRRKGLRVPLTPTEFRILDALARHRGQILSRPQLLDAIASDAEVFDRTLDKHIANLRKKIEDDPSQPRRVLTVFGIGYRYAAPNAVRPHQH